MSSIGTHQNSDSCQPISGSVGEQSNAEHADCWMRFSPSSRVKVGHSEWDSGIEARPDRSVDAGMVVPW